MDLAEMIFEEELQDNDDGSEGERPDAQPFEIEEPEVEEK